MEAKQEKMRHRTLMAVVVGVLTFIVSMPFTARAKDEKVLNVYNWANYIDEKTIPEFEQKFGVKVYYDVYDGNETLLAKLQAGASGFDVIFPSDYMVGIMIKLGLLEELDPSKIPNIANIDERFLKQPFDPQNRYSIPYAWGVAGIGYRADKINEPVTSWGILFDPKYSGRIVLLDDMRETIGFALKYLGYSLNTTNPDELQQAKDLLVKQKPLVKAYTSAQPELFLVSGEAWLVHNWSGDTYRIMAEDPNVKYVIPKEGSSKFIDTCAIPKAAPHKELAHKFINFLLEPEVDARIHNAIHYLSPNKVAMPYLNEEIRYAMSNMSPETAEKLEYIEDLEQATQLWDKIWTEIKAQ
jgi:spermidine/putrescine transport system substrate-binding protein